MPEPTETTQEEETSRRGMDEEVRAISAILRTLGDMDEAAQSRIVAYIASRYCKG